MMQSNITVRDGDLVLVGVNGFCDERVADTIITSIERHISDRGVHCTVMVVGELTGIYVLRAVEPVGE